MPRQQQQQHRLYTTPPPPPPSSSLILHLSLLILLFCVSPTAATVFVLNEANTTTTTPTHAPTPQPSSHAPTPAPTHQPSRVPTPSPTVNLCPHWLTGCECMPTTAQNWLQATGHCRMTDTVVTITNSDVSIHITGDLTITSSRLNVQCPSPSVCNDALIITTTGTTSFVNGTLYGASINVTAQDIQMDTHSLVSTSARALMSFEQGAGVSGSGGGHAGVGSAECTAMTTIAPINFFGHITTWMFGGHGSSSDTHATEVARGGGRISIHAYANVTIAGRLSADGGSGIGSSGGARGGGGAGGSVHVYSDTAMVQFIKAVISVRGGDASVQGGGGGSGGRVVIDAYAVPALPAVFVDGGMAVASGTPAPTTPCYRGGTGTVSSTVAGQTSLQCGWQVLLETEKHHEQEAAMCSGTVSSTIMQTAMYHAWINGVYMMKVVRCNAQLVDVGVTKVWQVGGGGVVVSDSSILSLSVPERLFLTVDGRVYVDSTSSIGYSHTLLIDSGVSVDIECAIVPSGDESVTPSRLALSARSITLGANSILSATGAVFSGDHVLLAGKITASISSAVQQCNTRMVTKDTCVSLTTSEALLVNVLVNSTTATLASTAQLTGGVMWFCAASNLTVAGSLVTTGFGCVTNTGTGVGGMSVDVPRGGAGHGGVGGKGTNSLGQSYNTGGPVYDAAYVGSGGGGMNGGDGGGLVVLSAHDTIIFAAGASIDASGNPGNKGSPTYPQPGGGGSGGAVHILAPSVIGHSGASVSCDGGAGGYGGGGGGSGGWIVVTSTHPYHGDSAFIEAMTVSGGGGDTSYSQADNGQLVHYPLCDAGASGPFCTPCVSGYYKSTTGPTPCSPCPPGNHSSTPGSTSCAACHAGYYSLGHASVCTKCADGSSSPAHSRLCTACAPGRFSNATLDTCMACANSTVSAGNATECTPCMGGFESGRGSSKCTPCPPGTHRDYTMSACGACTLSYYSVGNATECSRCTPGYTSEIGATTCTPCPGGTFRNSTSVVCVSCHPSTYSYSGYAECAACPNGRYSGPRATVCTNCTNAPSHSQYVNNFRSCEYQCDAGYVYPLCLTPFEMLVRSVGGVAGFAVIILSVFLLLSAPFAYFYYQSTRERQLKEKADYDAVLKLSPGTAAAFARDTNRGGGGGGGYHQLSGDGEGTDGMMSLDAFDLSLQPDDLPVCIHRTYFYGAHTFFDPLVMAPIADDVIQDMVIGEEFDAYARVCTELASWRMWEMAVYCIVFCLYQPLSSLWLHHRRRQHMIQLMAFHRQYNHAFLRNNRARALCSSIKFGFSPDCTLAWMDLLSVDENDHLRQQSVGKPTIPMVLRCSGDGSFDTPYQLDITDVMVKSLVQFFGPAWFSFLAHLNSHLRTISNDAPESLQSSLDYLTMMSHTGVGIGVRMPLGGLRVVLGRIPPLVDPNRTHKWSPALVVTHKNPFAVPPNSSPTLSQRAFLSPAATHTNAIVADIGGNTTATSNYNNTSRASNSSTTTEPGIDYPYGARLLDDDGVNDGTPFLPTCVKRGTLVFHLGLHGKQLHVVGGIGLLLVFHVALNFVIMIVFLQFIPLYYWLAALLFPLADFLSPLLGLAAMVTSSHTLMNGFLTMNCFSLINAVVLLCVGALNLDLLSLWGLLLPLLLILVKVLLLLGGPLALAHFYFVNDLVLGRRDFLRSKRGSESDAATSLLFGRQPSPRRQRPQHHHHHQRSSDDSPRLAAHRPPLRPVTGSPLRDRALGYGRYEQPISPIDDDDDGGDGHGRDDLPVILSSQQEGGVRAEQFRYSAFQ